MFTDDEIEGVVTSIVQSGVRRQYGILGNRRTDVSFSDIQEAASGVFILYPNAPFYLVDLGTRRLEESVSALRETVQDLVSTIVAVGRNVNPVTEMASLSNARSALSALEGAANSREGAFRSIEDVPAFSRFISSTDRFLLSTGKNVKQGGQIVQTPQEARGRLAGLVRELEAGHEEVVRRAVLLKDALSDFDSMDLPAAVTSNILSRSRSVLASRITQLEGMSETERLSVLRETILEILAARAAVKGIGNLSGPTTFVLFEGELSPYSDSEHPVIPASVLADLPGPYPIIEGAQSLDFELEGDSLTVQLPGSFVAALEGTVPEPYEITGANLLLTIQVTGFADVQVSLGIGVARTAEEVCSDINSTVPGPTPVIAEPYFNPLKFSGPVDLNTSGSVSDLDVIRSAGSWIDLGVKEGDLVFITDPTSSMYPSEYQVDVGGVSALVLTCSQISGAVPSDEIAKTVEIGPELRPIRIRITNQNDGGKPDYRLLALQNRTRLKVLAEDDSGASTLGFFPGIESRSRPTTAQEIVLGVNTSFSGAINGVARVSAKTEFLPSIYQGLGRTEPTDPNILVLYKQRGSGKLISAGSLVTLDEDPHESVSVGDILVIRGAPTQADIGVYGTITDLDPLRISMGSPITGGLVDYEIGPNIAGPTQIDMSVLVSGDSLNDGEYLAELAGPAPGLVPFELLLTRPFPHFQNLGGLPYLFSVSVGYHHVRFSSTDTSVNSTIEIFDFVPGDDAAPVFFSSGAADADGVVPWFRLSPTFPKNIELGDKLELNLSSYNTPDLIVEIVGLEQSLRILEISPGFEVSPGAVPMSTQAQIPFGRIRKAQKQNFDEFSEFSELWLALGTNQDKYFRDLDRHINDLTSNLNPSLSSVNTAKLHVQAMDQALEQYLGILDNYEASVVPAVDSMLATFLQRGCDRAVDVLLEGQFSVFFGLSQKGTSYAGAVMEQIQEVARRDLPVRKTKRRNNSAESILASWEDPDYEFDQSDVTGVDDVEIPADFDKEFPGQSY